MVGPSTVWRGIDGLLGLSSTLQRVCIQPGICQTACMLGNSLLNNRPNQTRSAGSIIKGSTHLDVVNIENAIIALVLVPPVRQSIAVLIRVDTIDEGVAIEVDVEVIVTIVWTPLVDDVPVHLRDLASGNGPVVVLVAVVIKDEIVV